MAATTLIVANLHTDSTYVDSFIVEVYTDSALTDMVGSSSCPSTGSVLGGCDQGGPIVINGLNSGDTYYARAGVVAPITGLTTWSPTSEFIAGVGVGPSGVTYTEVLTATTSGINAVITPHSVPTNISQYEVVWSTSNTYVPASTDTPMWTGMTDGSGTFQFFAGSVPNDTLYIFARAVDTGGLRQAWTAVGSSTVTAPVPPTAIQQGSYTFAVSTGSSNAYIVHLTPDPTIVAGSIVQFQASFANTGPATLEVIDALGSSVSGGAAAPIVKQGSLPLAAGDIALNQIVTVQFDGTHWQLTGAGGDTSNFATKAAVQQESYTYAADTGAANAYAVALTPTPTIVAGSVVSFKAAHANTGASTLAVNGGTATTITKNGTTALITGDIVVGQLITARYDGTEWQILAPGSGSGGITQLTGDVTAGPGSGSQVATLANSGVTAGTYINPTVTFDAKGRATFAANAGTPQAANYDRMQFNSGVTTIALSGYTPVSGKAIIVGLYLNSPGDLANVTGIADTAGNTWVSLGTYSGYAAVQMWICYNPAVTTTTITVTLSAAAGGFGDMSLIQYSSVTAQDGTGIVGGSHNIAFTQVTTGNLTTSNANDLLVVFGACNGPNTCSVDSPFTTDGANVATAGMPPTCFGSLLVSATGTYNATVTFTYTENQLVAVIFALKTTGSGTGGTGVTSFNTRTGVVTSQANDYTEAQISFSDITTNNVSTSKHGYAPKLPGDATKYLDGTGAYTAPSSSGLALTTTGSSGAATLVGSTLNIPVYSGGAGSSSYFNAMAFTTPPTTGWTSDNLGTGGTFDTTYGYPYIHGPLGSGTDNNRSAFRSVASTPWTITAGLLFDLSGVVHGGNTNTGNVGVGLILKDSSGKQITFRVAIPANSVNIAINVDKWTNSASYSANYIGTTANQYASIYGPIHQPMLMQISDDGTNLIFRLTIDGNHWYTFFSVSRTNWFASGPTQVGFHVGCYNSSGDNFGVDVALISWLQS